MVRRFLLPVALVVAAVAGAGAHTTVASAAPTGAVLVSGTAWAGQFAALGDLNVYSNGTNLSNSTPGPYGPQFQCTELATRWLAIRYHEPVNSGLGMAADWWTDGPSAPVPLIQHPNGGSEGPQFGDILVFGATSYDTTGHVAVVSGVTASTVNIVEQNWSSTAGSASLPISGTTMPARWGLPILGWLTPSLLVHLAYSPAGPSSGQPVSAPLSTATGATSGPAYIRQFGVTAAAPARPAATTAPAAHAAPAATHPRAVAAVAPAPASQQGPQQQAPPTPAVTHHRMVYFRRDS